MIGTNHTPWYPTSANPYTADLVQILKETANRHHALLPYIKSYTYAAASTGIPLIRALFLEAPSDPRAFEVQDAYFFGGQLLVAPIVTPNGRRQVYFPCETGYLEYFNKTTIQAGGTTADVSLSQHYIPVYVKAGGIVPTGDIYQGNNKWTADWMPSLAIEFYPSFAVAQSRFAYYNDAANKSVDVVMKTDPERRTVDISYGEVGVDGTIVVFTKDGTRNSTLIAGGGSVILEGVASLFSS